jgi:hypothetical protein
MIPFDSSESIWFSSLGIPEQNSRNLSPVEFTIKNGDDTTVTEKGITRMITGSSDQLQPQAIAQVAVFRALRERLAKEVSSSALLAELLQKVTSMQKAQATPEEFKERFYEFVCRAEEHLDVVRPFFPALVVFLPSHRAGGCGVEPNRSQAFVRSGNRAGIW